MRTMYCAMAVACCVVAGLYFVLYHFLLAPKCAARAQAPPSPEVMRGKFIPRLNILYVYTIVVYDKIKNSKSFNFKFLKYIYILARKSSLLILFCRHFKWFWIAWDQFCKKKICLSESVSRFFYLSSIFSQKRQLRFQPLKSYSMKFDKKEP